MSSASAATLADFEQLLDRRCDAAVDRAGRETARIFAHAASQNAPGNSRLGLILMESLEAVWRELLATVQGDLRLWANRTSLDRQQLRSVAEQKLAGIVPLLIKTARVDRSKSGLPGTEMLPNVAERIEALPQELAFMLRQFEIGMDSAGDPAVRSWWERVRGFAERFGVELAVAIAAAIALALLGFAS